MTHIKIEVFYVLDVLQSLLLLCSCFVNSGLGKPELRFWKWHGRVDIDRV